ncbi:2OG-Fe(II) oxygenase family protein [Stutzerimonas xanthomarina]|uniref:2OG-Fe(II) oxygenase family protein n=1 Tax=Stutzerimonas xanthomarina TaxID=271420 RepID=UPI003AA8AF10
MVSRRTAESCRPPPGEPHAGGYFLEATGTRRPAAPYGVSHEFTAHHRYFPLYNADEAGHLAVAETIDIRLPPVELLLHQGHPISAERIATLTTMPSVLLRCPPKKSEIDITRLHHRGYGAVATERSTRPAVRPQRAFDMGFICLPITPKCWPKNHCAGPTVIRSDRRLDRADGGPLPHTGSRLHPAACHRAHALGIERDFFDKRFVEPISVFRMIHYPPRQTATGAVSRGAGAHTDYGCVTCLSGPGRRPQVQTSGRMDRHAAHRRPYVVNIGDMMARWSNVVTSRRHIA